MIPLAATVQGTLKSDGSLELDEPPVVAPGRVQVTVQSLPEFPPDDPFWQRMQLVWKSQTASGHVARSVEEVEAERLEVRDEWEERSVRLEQLPDAP